MKFIETNKIFAIGDKKNPFYSNSVRANKKQSVSQTIRYANKYIFQFKIELFPKEPFPKHKIDNNLSFQ